MHLKTLCLTLKSEIAIKESVSKLRGYIAGRFKQYPILHHHIEEAGYSDTYPRIQYKLVEGTAIVLGIEECAEILKTQNHSNLRLQPGNKFQP